MSDKYVRTHPLLAKRRLEPEEAQLVMNIVKGMPAGVAAREAGVNRKGADLKKFLQQPRMANALRALQDEMLHGALVSRNEVVEGIMHAIRVAETSAEQISGWREIAKIYGYYEPEKHEVVVRPESATERELREMSEEELIRALDRDVIDVDPEAFVNGPKPLNVSPH